MTDKELNSALKGKVFSLRIEPSVVSNSNVIIERKGNGYSVKVRANGKVRKISKKMWTVTDDMMEFMGNYEGRISLSDRDDL